MASLSLYLKVVVTSFYNCPSRNLTLREAISDVAVRNVVGSNLYGSFLSFFVVSLF